jgi:hypothetical protein
MNKKLGILILILIALVSTSIFLTKEDNSVISNSKVVGNDIKGETTDICNTLQVDIKDELVQLPPLREWYIKSPFVDEKSINIPLDLPEEDVTVKYFLNDTEFEAEYSENGWVIDIPIDSLESNEYKLIVEITVCEESISKSFSFKVSNPVYVTWTIDWEGFDVKDQYLTDMANVSSKYNIPMTHLFNPYIYIYLSANRSTYLTNWVKNREGESIGLHLHMYDKLVKASGVEVNNNPAWGSPMGGGHDTPNSNYGYDDFKKIIQWSLGQFEAHDLPKPTIYRAGGWYIDEENINVLKNLGFRIETSGRTYYIHGSNQLVGHWNLEETTQPYQMNSKNQNLTNSPDMNIWEYPNNGGDSWAYTSEQLINRFKVNYKGGIASSDIVVTYLSHPHWFDKEGSNIDGALKYISNYNYNDDNGPVIYLTLDKVHEYTVIQ